MQKRLLSIAMEISKAGKFIFGKGGRVAGRARERRRSLSLYFNSSDLKLYSNGWMDGNHRRGSLVVLA
jgi:hypothetical protein